LDESVRWFGVVLQGVLVGWRDALDGSPKEAPTPEEQKDEPFSGRKTCDACGEQKHTSYFHMARSGDGFARKCKQCVKSRRAVDKERIRTDSVGRKYKYCSRCPRVGRKSYHHVSLFPKNGGTEDGYHKWCFICCDEGDRLWRMEKHVRKRLMENRPRLDARIEAEKEKAARRKKSKQLSRLSQQRRANR